MKEYQIPIETDVMLDTRPAMRRARLEQAGFDMKQDITKEVNKEKGIVIFRQREEHENG